MSTPDLDDRHELPAFHDEGTVQQLQRRNRILPKHLISGDVHMEYGIQSIKNTLPHLAELALGGTAVGTGINTPENYGEKVAKKISELTDLPFVTAPNKFEALATHDAIVETHGALKGVAVVSFTGWIPTAQWSLKLRQPSPISRALCRKL